MLNNNEAKNALDELIRKARVHFYKPIQIAEILYHHRVFSNINLNNLEDYRKKSKKWRDDICVELLGTKCTSSAKFQDDLFNDNAIPPNILSVLGEENDITNGAVEAYIYNRFSSKYLQLSNALNYCLNATKETFDVKKFIDSFWFEPGLKRSLDKIYEVIVFSLFSTLVCALDLSVEISVNPSKLGLIAEFQDFTQKVMCLDFAKPTYVQNARLYRVGVTNAADRGLDMYSNWGSAIQVKHLSLDEDLAENIVTSVSSDRIVIVCKDAEKKIILSLLTQIGWKGKIQSIITENDLVFWYKKALQGKFCESLGTILLGCLCEEIAEEFPSVDAMPKTILDRHYEKIHDPYWI